METPVPGLLTSSPALPALLGCLLPPPSRIASRMQMTTTMATTMPMIMPVFFLPAGDTAPPMRRGLSHVTKKPLRGQQANRRSTTKRRSGMILAAKEADHERDRLAGGVRRHTRRPARRHGGPVVARVVREVESESALGIAICAIASAPLWALALAWAWVIS